MFLAGVLAATVPAAEPTLTAQQIGARAEQADIDEMASLKGYTLMRHYVLDSPRFGKHAELSVRVTYRAGLEKKFEILSVHGAEGIGRRVFDKLIEAEKDASRQEQIDAMRIGPRNYDFALLGTENRNGQRCYVLQLKPKRKNRFLLDGKAWVSTDDFGVVAVQGRPSERVSFWVGKPEITQNFSRVEGVWMMSTNRSVAEVKIAGHSELSIESSNFKVECTKPSVSHVASVHSNH